MDGLPREEQLSVKDRIILLQYQVDHYEKMGEKMKNETNLGERFKDRTFNTFRPNLQPKAYKIAYDYATNFENNNGQGLLFMGNPGTGKTHLAAAITNYITDEYGIAVKFGNFISILNDIKKSFHSDEDIVRKLKEMPLLVIDDLGKERRSEWSEMILYDVINGRYEDYMPTIITTNLDPEEVKERFGEAVLSRIIEMCTGVVMQGKDVRMEGASWDV